MPSKQNSTTSVEDRIINASIDLFFENGFNETSLRAIAKASNTSESGVLRFFDTKKDILLAVFRKGYDITLNTVENNLVKNHLTKDQDDVLPVLITIAETILNLAESPDNQTRKVICLTWGEAGVSAGEYSGNNAIASNADIVFNTLDDLFIRGCREGVPPLEARRFFMGSIVECVFWQIFSIDDSNRENVLTVMSIFLKSILKTPNMISYEKLENSGVSLSVLDQVKKSLTQSKSQLIQSKDQDIELIDQMIALLEKLK